MTCTDTKYCVCASFFLFLNDVFLYVTRSFECVTLVAETRKGMTNMTDNEVLLSLSRMIEPIRNKISEICDDITKMRGDITEMRGDITEMRGDITEMRGDITEMRGDITEMRGDITEMRGDITEMKSDIADIKTRLKKVEVVQENVILPRLETIEACYTSTYDRYRRGADDFEMMKQDIEVVKKVVAEHSVKLQMIS